MNLRQYLIGNGLPVGILGTVIGIADLFYDVFVGIFILLIGLFGWIYYFKKGRKESKSLFF